MLLAQLLAGFQPLPLLPTSKLLPSGGDSQVSGFVYILEPCGSLQWTLLWGWQFLLPPQPPQDFFSQRFYFPSLGPLVAQSVLLPNCSSQSSACKYDTSHSTSHHFATPVLQLLPCHESSPPWPPVPTPPTCLDECFFFNSLVVGLPYSLIFWQFWLFFVFKFVVVLLLVVWGGKVYLLMLLSWPEVSGLAFLNFWYKHICNDLARSLHLISVIGYTLLH